MLNHRWLKSAIVLSVLTVVSGIILPAWARVAVPFRGVANATIIGVEPVPPDDLLLTAAAVGQATHLGRYDRLESILLHLDGTFEGSLVFVAANGDTLTADLAGAFTSATTAEGAYTFTGGTGRFADATGTAIFDAVTGDGIHFLITFDGHILY